MCFTRPFIQQQCVPLSSQTTKTQICENGITLLGLMPSSVNTRSLWPE